MAHSTKTLGVIAPVSYNVTRSFMLLDVVTEEWGNSSSYSMSLNRLLKLLRCDEDDDREWRRQYVSDNPFYNYVNFQYEGKLVEAFNKKNSRRKQRTDALNRVIRQDIVQFLYDGGKGKVVRSKCNSFAPQTTVSTDDFRIYKASFLPLLVQEPRPRKNANVAYPVYIKDLTLGIAHGTPKAHS